MASSKDLAKDLARQEAELRQLFNDIPRIMGVQAVEFTRKNFERQGMIRNGALSKWAKRIDGTPRNSRKILSDRNNLEDSIRYRIIGRLQVAFGVDGRKVPYAQIHNEGGTIKVTPQMKKYFWAMYSETGDDFWKHLALTKKTVIEIPKREYLAVTPDLEKNIERELNKRMDRIFKK